MDSHRWGDATWTELADLGLVGQGSRTVSAHGSAAVIALLPVGAVEAHGAHLPLITDGVIAQAAATAALAGLRGLGFHPLVLPPFVYTAAPFASGFPGTISLRPGTVSAWVADVAGSLGNQGAAALVLVNAHLDPTHLRSLREGAAACSGPMPVIFPDVTRRPWALRLTEEFRSGACHGGRYETSVVMAAAPQMVRDRIRRKLPRHAVSLTAPIGDGIATFEAAGIPDAYCGDPASATREEGRRTIEVLGKIVVDAVAARFELDRDSPEGPPDSDPVSLEGP